MPREPSETPATPKDPEAAAAKAKAKRGAGEKPRRTHGERAVASLRAAKRGQEEVSEPAERARFLLAEANVLALLEVADALGSPEAGTEQVKTGG